MKAQTSVELHIFFSIPQRFNRLANKFTKCNMITNHNIIFIIAQSVSPIFKMKYVPTPNPRETKTIVILNHIQNDLFSLINALYCLLLPLPCLLRSAALVSSKPSDMVSSFGSVFFFGNNPSFYWSFFVFILKYMKINYLNQY